MRAEADPSPDEAKDRQRELWRFDTGMFHADAIPASDIALPAAGTSTGCFWRPRASREIPR